MRTTVERYFTCLDTEDWNQMRELWHEDGSMKAVGARPRTNRDEVVAYFSRLFEPWREHVDRPVRMFVHDADRVVVVEVEFTGRTHDGRQVVFDAVDVFDFGPDGRIVRLTNWYDLDFARKSLQQPAVATGELN